MHMFWARPYPAVTVQAEGMLNTHQIGQILKEGQILKHGVFFSPFGIFDGTGKTFEDYLVFSHF